VPAGKSKTDIVTHWSDGIPVPQDAAPHTLNLRFKRLCYSSRCRPTAATGTHSLVFTEATFRNHSGTSFHAKSAIVPPGGSRRQFEGLQQPSGHHRVSNTDIPCQVVPRVALVVGV